MRMGCDTWVVRLCAICNIRTVINDLTIAVYHPTSNWASFPSKHFDLRVTQAGIRAPLIIMTMESLESTNKMHAFCPPILFSPFLPSDELFRGRNSKHTSWIEGIEDWGPLSNSGQRSPFTEDAGRLSEIVASPQPQQPSPFTPPTRARLRRAVSSKRLPRRGSRTGSNR